MIQIAIILGSTRPGRGVVDVARWVADAAGRHPAVKAGEASLELVDIADFELPLLDEPAPAVFGYYQHAHTKRWAATIDRFDIGYGVFGGTRAAEQLRQTMGEIKVADVHAQVAINPHVDFDFTDSKAGVVAPDERQETALTTMLDEVPAWSRALRVLRVPTASADPA